MSAIFLVPYSDSITFVAAGMIIEAKFPSVPKKPPLRCHLKQGKEGMSASQTLLSDSSFNY